MILYRVYPAGDPLLCFVHGTWCVVGRSESTADSFVLLQRGPGKWNYGDAVSKMTSATCRKCPTADEQCRWVASPMKRILCCGMVSHCLKGRVRILVQAKNGQLLPSFLVPHTRVLANRRRKGQTVLMRLAAAWNDRGGAPRCLNWFEGGGGGVVSLGNRCMHLGSRRQLVDQSD